MFEQTFKNIDDILWKDAGCSTELDYAEQSSWILFLKWLDDYEKDKETKAKLDNKKFKPTLDKEFQWSSWAIVKTKDGKVDFNKILTGRDLKKFVDDKLFPYLSSFRNKAESFDTLEYKIGEVFSELRNKLQDGYTLRGVIDEVDNLHFRSNEQKHELSALYEEKIKNMGNAGRNGGEYYTPRPLIKSIVKVMDPKVDETVYDGAVGSAGFLVEAFEHMRQSKSLTATELKKLQTKTFYGAEKKTLAYIIGIMNMILHGIESPNIIHQNTLETNIQEIQNKDRVDVIIANPPFGGKEKSNIQENFPIKTKETAYLFLQQFIKKLKIKGRCGVVIKNTFLSNPDKGSVNIRKLLLEQCDLHTILDLPKGTFLGTGNETVVLFFEKGKSTKKVWYYQFKPPKQLGKTNPLTEEHLLEFTNYYINKKESKVSWSVDISEINQKNWNLTVKNKNNLIKNHTKSPDKIIDEIDKINSQIQIINSQSKNELSLIKKIFKDLDKSKKNWKTKTIGDVCELLYGKGLDKSLRNGNARYPAYGANGIKTYSKKKLFDKPSIIIGRKGSAGELNYVEKPFWALDVTYYVRLIDGKIDLKFLYYVLKQQNLPSLARGVKPGLNRNEVYEISFSLPPLDEQKKIVNEIEKIFKKINEIQKLNDLKFKNYNEILNTMLNKLSS